VIERGIRPQRSRELGAPHHRHHDVGQHDVRRVITKRGKRQAAVDGQPHVVAELEQDVAQHFGQTELVVHDED
jgi:hypothetical protein